MTLKSREKLIVSALEVLNSVKKSAPINASQAEQTLDFIYMDACLRSSLDSFSESIGLSKRSLYRLIRYFESQGIEYKSIPQGFRGVHEKRKRLAKGKRERLKRA
ncbi:MULTISPECIES: hypothetical protein [Pseudoalteromonas]|uniref:hypothetical protein n=1 Tax=Pseudoalteromonas TaxID=53246 RepID=UPI00110BB6A4|nr:MULTISPECIES: hypothetical protein [Pseudoalteromonas]MCG7545378.1 hypothetical protein [Pseudoalteromonas sp. MM17-2]TMO87657.1 hypothetical protein CWC12_10275 [Pseudoalteromonas ruthenica]TMP22266.1 hypothetical protein CWC06_15735 [Pseudoalteromonas ruthenica]